MKRREIHHLGAADADIIHIRAAVCQTARQRLRKARRAFADIPPDRYFARFVLVRIRASDTVTYFFIHFRRHDAANVIRLKAVATLLQCFHLRILSL